MLPEDGPLGARGLLGGRLEDMLTDLPVDQADEAPLLSAALAVMLYVPA
jgi:hypothetical protein